MCVTARRPQVVFDAAALERGGRVITFELWDQNVFADELVGAKPRRALFFYLDCL